MKLIREELNREARHYLYGWMEELAHIDIHRGNHGQITGATYHRPEDGKEYNYDADHARELADTNIWIDEDFNTHLDMDSMLWFNTIGVEETELLRNELGAEFVTRLSEIKGARP